MLSPRLHSQPRDIYNYLELRIVRLRLLPNIRRVCRADGGSRLHFQPRDHCHNLELSTVRQILLPNIQGIHRTGGGDETAKLRNENAQAVYLLLGIDWIGLVTIKMQGLACEVFVAETLSPEPMHVPDTCTSLRPSLVEGLCCRGLASSGLEPLSHDWSDNYAILFLTIFGAFAVSLTLEVRLCWLL